MSLNTITEGDSVPELDPYSLFTYAINSFATKEKYLSRLKSFFDYIKLEGNSLEERCTNFVGKSQSNSRYASNKIINYLHMLKERVNRKEITAGTLRNCVKPIQLFCNMNEIEVHWVKLTIGLPRVRRYANDRAPTLEEIRKMMNYTDDRIKAIVSVMASSGIRVGAWDSIRWKHVSPITREGKIVAARLTVYAGDDVDEYFSFITSEAYSYVEEWINFRKQCGEPVTPESWILRNIWNSKKGCKLGTIKDPRKLQSVAVKRAMEAALWKQGIRKSLEEGQKRHEFQTDHGLRKWFKTRCELAHMRSTNIELLMGHSIGISDSYFRPTQDELLEDYLKAVPFLTIGEEKILQLQVDELRERKQEENYSILGRLSEKDEQISNLLRRDVEKNDAIAQLGDQIIMLSQKIENFKKQHI